MGEKTKAEVAGLTWVRFGEGVPVQQVSVERQRGTVVRNRFLV